MNEGISISNALDLDYSQKPVQGRPLIREVADFTAANMAARRPSERRYSLVIRHYIAKNYLSFSQSRVLHV